MIKKHKRFYNLHFNYDLCGAEQLQNIVAKRNSVNELMHNSTKPLNFGENENMKWEGKNNDRV